MGLRYRIPFVDYNDTHYVVEVHREDYDGEPTELQPAVSCFVVSGTDDDFMYVPLRTSSATIGVLDSELLLDLYSINNQYAPVKLYKEGVLEWTGYIKPEQFTQPYVQTAQSVSVECVSAVSTLELISYKEMNALSGTVTLWNLLKYLINQTRGGYRGVYIPWVYGETSAMTENVFEKITLIENNFLSEEMNLMEVLEAVCKLLNWTLWDVGGCLWFVDADHRGTYRLYDEALETYHDVSLEEVLIQDIGFLGSDANTLDIVPGYNKASVKALNNVFDEPVKDEPFDALKPYRDYLVRMYNDADGPHASRKLFLKPMLWKLYAYDSQGTQLEESVLNGYDSWQLNEVFGGILMREANYKCVASNDPTPDSSVTDFDYKDSVQIRVDSTSRAGLAVVAPYTPAIKMTGENAVYADCAISIDGTFEAYFDDDMAGPVVKTSKLTRSVVAMVSCGVKWYDGERWTDKVSFLGIEVDEAGNIISNRTPYTPYKNISGYVIPMDFFVGKPEITIYCPIWGDEYNVHHCTGVKIRNLKFGYAKKEDVLDEGENGDRVYENVVNEAYMSDCEEIEFNISSYNADGASYSKALLNGRWMEKNLYCAVVNQFVRPEELMIRRIVSRYGETKIKLTEGIRMTDAINPITAIKERTQPGRTFRLTSGEWDYERGRLMIQIQEDAE